MVLITVFQGEQDEGGIQGLDKSDLNLRIGDQYRTRPGTLGSMPATLHRLAVIKRGQADRLGKDHIPPFASGRFISKPGRIPTCSVGRTPDEYS